MPRFVFALEPLLKARRHVERQKQRVVGALQRERLRLEQTLQRHQANLTEGKDALRQGLTGRVDVTTIRLQAVASMGVMKQAHRIVLELAGLHKRLAAARAELLQAATARRAIELLKERRFALWKSAVNKEEIAVNDELAATAGARQLANFAPRMESES